MLQYYSFIQYFGYNSIYSYYVWYVESIFPKVLLIIRTQYYKVKI